MALLEHREHGEDLRERACRLGPRSLPPCPHLEVLENRHPRPELTRLGHEHEAVGSPRVCRPVHEVAAVFKRVVFPAPFAPTSVRISPASTRKETSQTACTFP